MALHDANVRSSFDCRLAVLSACFRHDNNGTRNE
jgi:hypothetical protein